MGIFSRINKGLKKTRENMSGAIDSMLHGKTEIDDEFYDELEEILVMGDVGCMTASEIVEQLRERVMRKHLRKPEAVKNEIKEIVAEMLEGGEEMSLITLPSVILVIGVNGVGKTTSIGKLAAMYKNEGKKVILAAADTFRAAAIEQLEEWANRAGVEIVKHREGGFGYDPLFLPDEFPGKTMAQLTAEEKDSISHRGKALRLLTKKLEEII